MNVTRFPAGIREVYVRAEPRAVVDGSQLEPPDEAPTGTESPTVLGWTNRESGAWAPGAVVAITPEEAAQWSVRVSQPDDTAISVLLQAVEGSAR